MFSVRSFKSSFLAVAAASLLALPGIAQAAGYTDSFDAAPGAGYTRLFGNEPGGESRLSNPGEPSLGGRSVRLAMPDVDNGYSRVSIDAPNNTPFGRLRDVSATFSVYMDSSSAVLNTPYVLLGLDNNGDGHYDFSNESLIIQFSSMISGTPATNTWLNEGFNGMSDAHVQVDRGMLAGDSYQPDSTPDRLSDLYDLNYNATTKWGDLNVFRIRVAAGYFAAGAGDQPYLAYVDNVNVQAVPEPTSMAALGLGALALLRKRRRSA